MIRTEYQHTLDSLKERVIEMGEETQRSVEDSIVALDKLDIDLANRIIEKDQVIDDLDNSIEKCVQQIIARQSPTARDMRLVTSCMKMAIDIERIADLAVDISKASKCIEGEHVKPLTDIKKMGDTVSNMLQQAIIAFNTLDSDLARETTKEDDKIDELLHSTEGELIERMKDDKSIVNNASYLLFTLHYLERMGDHVCNICESIVYMVSGEKVNLN